MAQPFKILFSPIRLKGLTLKNRLVNAPHTTNFADHNMPDDRYVEYLRARAEGGLGLIIAGMMVVHPTARCFEGVVFGYDERIVPWYRKMADAVHKYDTKIFVQLNHSGRQMNSSTSGLPIVGFSPLPGPLNREVPKEMEKEDIKEMIKAFAHSAKLAKEGGIDGVELHASTGYLISSSLSPWSNKRTDEYGGSFENRMRFVNETLDAIRAACGKDYIVGLKLGADDYMPGGLTLDDTKLIAKKLTDAGKVDFIHVYGGTYATFPITAPPMGTPLAHLSHLAAGIKEAANVPVMTVSRINSPELAERLLEEGQADLIGMARAIISDPEFPNKARQGRVDDIRTCIGCNQGCVQRLFDHKSITCTQNPAVGKEKELEVSPAPKKKKVVVVGGGPAGMEAAWVAALRGHEVVLYEKEPELGGQVNLVKKVPMREEFDGVTRFRRHELNRLGVKVKLNIAATDQLVLSEAPNAVVIATGSIPNPGKMPGVEGKNVFSAEDVLSGKAALGQNVLIADEGEAHGRCCFTAEFIFDQGKSVQIISPPFFVGRDMDPSTLMVHYAKVLDGRVKLIPNTALVSIEGKSATVRNIHSGAESVIEGIDSFVLVSYRKSVNDLYYKLKGKLRELYAAGDCVSPRKAINAIYEARTLAVKI